VAVYRRSRRHRFVLVLLVLTSVTAITLDYRGSAAVETVRRTARDAFAPVQSAAGRVMNPVGDLLGGITRYRDLKAENRRLRARLDLARADSVRGADAERVRQALLDLQNLRFAPNLPSVSARVISAAPSNFQLSLSLDRGQDSGIQKGMPVVTGAGLVGRIVDVSRERSTVLLVTDRASRVGVRLAGSGDVGLARGAGPQEPLPLDLIDVETPVAVGEAVVTSGLEQSLFPPDIPVGRVRSARLPPGALQQDIGIDPVVDLRRLEFVKVLQWRPR